MKLSNRGQQVLNNLCQLIHVDLIFPEDLETIIWIIPT